METKLHQINFFFLVISRKFCLAQRVFMGIRLGVKTVLHLENGLLCHFNE